MIRNFKYRIYPTKKQEKTLNTTFTNCRRLYNVALQHRNDVWRSYRKSVSCYDQINELPKIKEEFPQYKEIHSQVLQNVLVRVDLAFKGFFRRLKIKKEGCGFPRFKGEDRFKSITYLQSGFDFTKDKKRIKLSKIGLVKIRAHRQIPIGAKTKTCCIKKEADKWYCVLSLDIPFATVEKKVVRDYRAIGIDLGLTDFAVLSNGEEIKNPKYLKQSEAKLKETQSRYSKEKTKATKKKLVKLHYKVANQRKDFQHKLSSQLVNRFDLIAYEDLNVKGMMKDDRYKLNKHIGDASWSSFISMVKYKAESAGTYAIAVNPKGTSQKCSGCGAVVKKDLYVRVHACPVCSLSLSRDHNAAINILASGTDARLSEAPSPLGKG